MATLKRRFFFPIVLLSARPCHFGPPCKDRVPASSSASSTLVSTGHIFWLTVWHSCRLAGGRAVPGPPLADLAGHVRLEVWMLAVSNGPFEGPSQNNPLRRLTPSLRRSDGRFNQPQISRVPFASFAHSAPTPLRLAANCCAMTLTAAGEK